jgi:hypothetical protein
MARTSLAAVVIAPCLLWPGRCGIHVAAAVVVATYPSHGLVAIHPAITVSRLVHQIHTHLAAANAG